MTFKLLTGSDTERLRGSESPKFILDQEDKDQVANNSALNQELLDPEESGIFKPAHSQLSRRGDILADIKNNNSEKNVQAYEKLSTMKKMNKREG